MGDLCRTGVKEWRLSAGMDGGVRDVRSDSVFVTEGKRCTEAIGEPRTEPSGEPWIEPTAEAMTDAMSRNSMSGVCRENDYGGVMVPIPLKPCTTQKKWEE